MTPLSLKEKTTQAAFYLKKRLPKLPEIGLILGTGLAPLVPYLLPAIRREFDTRLLAARFIEIGVEGAPPDPAPASTGGALLALDAVISHPASWVPAS